jgi:hypothetical protein
MVQLLAFNRDRLQRFMRRSRGADLWWGDDNCQLLSCLDYDDLGHIVQFRYNLAPYDHHFDHPLFNDSLDYVPVLFNDSLDFVPVHESDEHHAC